MNALEKLILATAAVVYGMTAQLPACETAKETQDAITKWYDEVYTSVSTEIKLIGVKIENLPDNFAISWEEHKENHAKAWDEGMKQNKENWETIKGWFTPKTEEVKK